MRKVLFTILGPAVLFVPAAATSPMSAVPAQERAEIEPSKTASELTEPGQNSGVVDPRSFPDIVARVDAVEITRSELIARADGVRERLGIEDSSIGFFRRVLDELVGAALLYQASAAKGMIPTDAELDSQIATLRSRFPSEEEFVRGLSAQGLTVDELKAMMTKDMSIAKYIDSEVVPKVTVSEDEMRKFYDENQEQMKRPEQAKLRHILIRVEPSSSEEARGQAQQRAEKLHERLKAGEDFAALAKEYSEDPGSKASGGDLSWVSRGQTVPAFEEAAFGLKPGEMSHVVQTQFGYHIIKLAEHRPSATLPFGEVRDQIGEFLRQEHVQKQVQAEVDALRAKAKVEILI